MLTLGCDRPTPLADNNAVNVAVPSVNVDKDNGKIRVNTPGVSVNVDPKSADDCSKMSAVFPQMVDLCSFH